MKDVIAIKHSSFEHILLANGADFFVFQDIFFYLQIRLNMMNKCLKFKELQQVAKHFIQGAHRGFAQEKQIEKVEVHSSYVNERKEMNDSDQNLGDEHFEFVINHG